MEEEYCWAITRAKRRSCYGRPSFVALDTEFHLDSTVYTFTFDHICTQCRSALHLLQLRNRPIRGACVTYCLHQGVREGLSDLLISSRPGHSQLTPITDTLRHCLHEVMAVMTHTSVQKLQYVRRCSVKSDKLTVTQQLENFPVLCGIRKTRRGSEVSDAVLHFMA